MAGLALSGLASGFDWKGIVDQLIEVSRAPQNRLRREKSELATRTNALNEVRSAVASLKSSVGSLGSESALLKKAATMASPDSVWKPSASTNATPGEYNFSIKQTARASVVRGASGIGNTSALDPALPISSSPIGRTLTTGFFTINGKKITVDTSSTLNSLASDISSATGLSASYTGGKFIISSTVTPITLGTGADTSNFLQAMDLASAPITIEGRLGGVDLNTLVIPPGTLIDESTPLTAFGYLDDGSDDGYFRINGQDFGVVPSLPQTLGNFLNTLRAALGPGNSVTFDGSRISITGPSGIAISEPSQSPFTSILHDFGLTKPDNSEDYSTFVTGTGATPTFTPIPNRFATAGSLGKVNLTANLADANLANPPTGSGSFFVNGAQITYDSSQDSIQDILDRITGSAAQVIASYDLVNDAIVLTNKNTGAVGTFVTTSDPADTTNTVTDSGGLVAALFGTGALSQVIQGRDAVFSVNNGGDLTNRSNIFGETVHGIRGLTVDASNQPSITLGGTPATEKVTVKGDPSAARDAVNTFITNYNALQAVIEKHTKVTYSDGKVTTGVLAGSREMADVSRTLRQELFRNIGFSGSIQRLSDMGVTSSGIENVISLSNSALLESKINTDASGVLDYFGNSTNGLITRLNKLLGDSSTDVSAASGKIGIQLTTIQKQNTSLDKQIAEFERRLESQRQLMESSFIAMERAQSKFQQQSSYLQRTFASNNK
jgi:flagellar hook-associated protein 2